MDVILPPYLKSGDRVAIVATARWLTKEQAVTAERVLTSWGLEVVWGKQVFTQEHQLAGNAEERLADLQQAMDDPSIQAILIARGGYGTVHLLDGIDWKGMRQHPKWICGYSDVTGLLAECTRHGFASIHSTMPVSFHDATPDALKQLRDALFGELIDWNSTERPTTDLSPIEGILVGGNVSVLYSLMGSVSLEWLRTESATPFILFLEDVDEMYYHLDRMMMGLLRAGYFKHVSALCIGGLTMMRDNTTAFGFSSNNPWGSDGETTMRKMGALAGIPVISGWPAGHLSNNQAFYSGRKVRLHSAANAVRMEWSD